MLTANDYNDKSTNRSEPAVLRDIMMAKIDELLGHSPTSHHYSANPLDALLSTINFHELNEQTNLNQIQNQQLSVRNQ